jgi:hypothetical protein
MVPRQHPIRINRLRRSWRASPGMPAWQGSSNTGLPVEYVRRILIFLLDIHIPTDTHIPTRYCPRQHFPHCMPCQRRRIAFAIRASALICVTALILRIRSDSRIREIDPDSGHRNKSGLNILEIPVRKTARGHRLFLVGSMRQVIHRLPSLSHFRIKLSIRPPVICDRPGMPNGASADLQMKVDRNTSNGV